MTTWPSTSVPPCVTICPWSLESMQTTLAALAIAISSAASAVYPLANLALYVPFTLTQPITVVKLFAVNGAAVSGNVDVGIYSVDGTRLTSSGSTAQAGTTAVQEFDITDIQIGPGQFYLALACDNTTAAFSRVVPGAAPTHRSGGILEQASGFPLPASATFAANASSAYIPVWGLTTRSVI